MANPLDSNVYQADVEFPQNPKPEQSEDAELQHIKKRAAEINRKANAGQFNKQANQIILTDPMRERLQREINRIKGEIEKIGQLNDDPGLLSRLNPLQEKLAANKPINLAELNYLLSVSQADEFHLLKRELKGQAAALNQQADAGRITRDDKFALPPSAHQQLQQEVNRIIKDLETQGESSLLTSLKGLKEKLGTNSPISLKDLNYLLYVSDEYDLQQNKETDKIKNLVFRGGGAKGIAYIGVLQALFELELLKDVESVSGASAGALLAMFVGLGFDFETIKHKTSSLNMGDFAKGGSFGNLAERGYYSTGALTDYLGDVVQESMSQIRKILEDKEKFDPKSEIGKLLQMGDAITVNQLKELKKLLDATGDPDLTGKIKNIIITVTEYDPQTNITQAIYCGGKDPTPLDNLPLKEVAALSASLPGFFKSRTINGKIYSDGGGTNNTPTEAVEKDLDNSVNKSNTLVFCLEEKKKPEYTNLLHNKGKFKYGLKEFFGDLISRGEFSKSRKREFEKLSGHYHHNVVLIQTDGIGTTSQNVSDAEKRSVVRDAYVKTMQHIGVYFNIGPYKHENISTRSEAEHPKVDSITKELMLQEKIKSNFEILAQAIIVTQDSLSKNVWCNQKVLTHLSKQLDLVLKDIKTLTQEGKGSKEEFQAKRQEALNLIKEAKDQGNVHSASNNLFKTADKTFNKVISDAEHTIERGVKPRSS